jgi:hypothetical protein
MMFEIVLSPVVSRQRVARGRRHHEGGYAILKVVLAPVVRCHSSIETIRAGLVGNDRHEHVFALNRWNSTTSTRRRCWTPTASSKS